MFRVGTIFPVFGVDVLSVPSMSGDLFGSVHFGVSPLIAVFLAYFKDSSHAQIFECSVLDGSI